MKNQFMPMFWGDFFANTLHLSAHEIGAYVLLIAHAWEHEGKIPLGLKAQKIARVDNRHWRQTWTTLAPFFTPILDNDGSATVALSSRVAVELSKAAEISKKRKVAAEQMHTNKRANAVVKSMHVHPLPLEEKESLLCKEGKDAKKNPLPKPVASTSGWRPRIDDEERRPPRTKSDNALEPIPERPPPRRAP